MISIDILMILPQITRVTLKNGIFLRGHDLQAVADRLAEAFSELIHLKIRCWATSHDKSDMSWPRMAQAMAKKIPSGNLT